MDEDTAALKTQLYAACEEACSSDPDRLFTQEDLTALDIIPPKDLKKLLQLIQILTNERLFAPVHLHSGLAWRLRPEAEAAKYKQLTSHDQVLVYEIIDAAGAEGAWQQDIKRRLNVQDNALRKALKELETKRLVVQFTTVENTTKKMWIKANIKPSSRATGGPWYTDQFLDEAFIEALQSVVMSFIKNRGSYLSKGDRGARSVSPVLPKKGTINGATSEAAIKSKKRTADAISKDDAPVAPTSRPRKTIRLPLPAGYMEYPTTEEITAGIQAAEVAKGQPLKQEHVQELIDILVWDNRVEEIRMGNRVGYRATRISKQNPSLYSKPGDEDFWEPRSNGQTTVPCGKCPVFDLCEEGGPVWAGGCEYFDQWLA
ncbi:RNA polymerase Rpc34 subunit [Xylaria bambusicola]|uniref:RNA polymerase Rpc34 subunit n=1 Tax=Xylaria bambusicola TaxID=326684 RepID=UPI00200857EF|nr:RNA polymerase Rpc34 subunit [Xylaria bambusicola]KAI0509108.1 RNA polymerase Rpc34 subunit [Xylaria bambusicola]